VIKECYRYLHRLEALKQAQEKDGNSGIKLTGKQPDAIEIPHWVHSTYYYKVVLSLYRGKWITISRLLWPSQWLVTRGHHLPVTIYLHVASSSSRHKRKLVEYNILPAILRPVLQKLQMQ